MPRRPHSGVSKAVSGICTSAATDSISEGRSVLPCPRKALAQKLATHTAGEPTNRMVE